MILPDSCLNCGGEDHVEDTCPEWSSLEEYENFLAGLDSDLRAAIES